jgi:hypothetical protein
LKEPIASIFRVKALEAVGTPKKNCISASGIQSIKLQQAVLLTVIVSKQEI